MRFLSVCLRMNRSGLGVILRDHSEEIYLDALSSVPYEPTDTIRMSINDNQFQVKNQVKHAEV